MLVLLVEDDERIVEFVRRGLDAEGYQIEVAMTGADAVRLGRQRRHALIILDLLLPDIDGREVCHRLRAAQVHVPILMLTALDTLEDKVAGLQMSTGRPARSCGGKRGSSSRRRSSRCSSA
jgi:two-component system OmpR family response regulator